MLKGHRWEAFMLYQELAKKLFYQINLIIFVIVHLRHVFPKNILKFNNMSVYVI